MWSGYANTPQILCSASLSSEITLIAEYTTDIVLVKNKLLQRMVKQLIMRNTSIALDYCAEYEREYPDSKKSFFM